MQPFNDGAPLRVVRLDTNGELGVVDASRRRVWKENDLASMSMPSTSFSIVDTPTIPEHYGKWHGTSIGGLSDTVRRTGIVQANPKHKGAVVVFATHVPEDLNAMISMLDAWELGYAMGDVEEMEGYGRVVEVVVYDPSQLSRVAAIVARVGATPILEDTNADARRSIGIERLDRIEAQIVSRDTNMAHENEDAYGVRRGRENWRFPWIPSTWTRVPLTLDHMVENLLHDDISCIPQPLCQHVARRRLEMGLYDRMGTLWVRSEHPPTDHEIHGGSNIRYPHRVVLQNEPLHHCLSSGRTTITVEELSDWNLEHVDHARYLIEAENGIWYRPRDTRNHLMSHIPTQRWVSCALSEAQSKQLCTCFYLLLVEGVRDGEVRHAIHLILFRYMVERGYTSRRMGKYTQDAMHIGNGDGYRPFRRLTQYAPERLPAEVLSKLCGRNGRLKTRGSKGTRSKYRTLNRYQPSRRLKRSREHEQEMVTVER
tara:strand:+ start:1900 stop:3351 length:1452 start_codon:yes stop_codon:yes gene_type:complete